MATAKRKGVVVAFSVLLATMGMLIGARPASAVPVLQLYLEGATYDSATESWTLNPVGSSGGTPFKLWTIGNVAGPGGAGTIFDVRLSVAYDSQFGPLRIVLTPSTASGDYQSQFFDPSVSPTTDGDPYPASPGIPVGLDQPDGIKLTRYVPDILSDADLPKLSSGKVLPSHGEYHEGVAWQEFLLGDYSLTDSPITDFNENFDDTTVPYANSGQINVYDVQVFLAEGSSLPSPHGISLHFDLYDSVQSGNKAKSVFAPFSHDADGVTIVPTPAATVLGGIGFAILGMMRPRRGRGAAAADSQH